MLVISSNGFPRSWFYGIASSNLPWNAMWWVSYEASKAGVMDFIFWHFNHIHSKRGITVVPLFFLRFVFAVTFLWMSVGSFLPSVTWRRLWENVQTYYDLQTFLFSAKKTEQQRCAAFCGGRRLFSAMTKEEFTSLCVCVRALFVWY